MALTRKQMPLVMEATYARFSRLTGRMHQGPNVSFHQLRTYLPALVGQLVPNRGLMHRSKTLQCPAG